jgi:hypothetical protein
LNGLDTIVRALTRQTETFAPTIDEPGTTRTGQLRAMLKAGPLTCEQLSRGSGISRNSVSGLLNEDVKKGRLLLERGVYRTSPDYDADKAKRLRDAAALLRAAGYVVVRAPK